MDEVEREKQLVALRSLDAALCNFLNQAGDPFEPVDMWRDFVWDAFGRLSKAYNDAHVANCFPEWRDVKEPREARRAFTNWMHRCFAGHPNARLMVLFDSIGPVSAQAFESDAKGQVLSEWQHPRRD